MPQGAPFDPEHVTHLFQSSLDEIRARGPAEVVIGGRSFNVTREFLEDLTEQKEAVHRITGRSGGWPGRPPPGQIHRLNQGARWCVGRAGWQHSRYSASGRGVTAPRLPGQSGLLRP